MQKLTGVSFLLPILPLDKQRRIEVNLGLDEKKKKKQNAYIMSETTSPKREIRSITPELESKLVESATKFGDELKIKLPENNIVVPGVLYDITTDEPDYENTKEPTARDIKTHESLFLVDVVHKDSADRINHTPDRFVYTFEGPDGYQIDLYSNDGSNFHVNGSLAQRDTVKFSPIDTQVSK